MKEEFLKAREARNTNLILTELSSLPDGFIYGGTLNVTDTDVTVNPLIANISGKRVAKPLITNIRDMEWNTLKKSDKRYYIYLDKGGVWYVDSITPVIVEGKYGTYDPRNSRRHVGSIYIKADGTYEEITVLGTIALDGFTKGSVLFIGDISVVTEDNANLFWDATNNRLGIGIANPTLPLDVKAKSGHTAIGGFAIKLTNKTGGNTVEGQLIQASTGTDDAFSTCVANSDTCIGIVLDAGVGDGSQAWVTVSGIADVLMDSGGSVRGDRIITSGTVGSADVWNTGGAVATHFQEIGHCIETRTGAGLARCILHFN